MKSKDCLSICLLIWKHIHEWILENETGYCYKSLFVALENVRYEYISLKIFLVWIHIK